MALLEATTVYMYTSSIRTIFLENLHNFSLSLDPQNSERKKHKLSIPICLCCMLVQSGAEHLILASLSMFLRNEQIENTMKYQKEKWKKASLML